ncbi:MAG TPA: hypothetical protein VGI98_04205 [Candidatus Limnocylindrales bacterium]|jgi:hypothetical protein
MAFVAPKLVLTPLLIASASLAGRRWGALLSGWLIALPLTSGPIALFITLEQGSTAGTQAATGALVGAAAQVAFAAGYVLASRRWGWLPSLGVASAGFVTATVLVAVVVPPDPPLLFGLAIVTIVVGLAFLRTRRVDGPLEVVQPGRWDIPARAIVATTLVLGISGLAPVIGGHAAGVIATYPVYISVLTSFAHRSGGPGQALSVVRGLLLGLPGFSTFFLVLATFLPSMPVVPAFGIALGFAVALNLAILLATIRFATARPRMSPRDGAAERRGP